jgi:hypothetical protein
VGKAGFNNEARALNPPQLAQSKWQILRDSEPRSGRYRRCGNEKTDVRYTSGLLRLGGERRGEEAASDHAKEGPSLHHSMTRIDPHRYRPPHEIRGRAEHSTSADAGVLGVFGGIVLKAA